MGNAHPDQTPEDVSIVMQLQALMRTSAPSNFLHACSSDEASTALAADELAAEEPLLQPGGVLPENMAGLHCAEIMRQGSHALRALRHQVCLAHVFCEVVFAHLKACAAPPGVYGGAWH